MKSKPVVVSVRHNPADLCCLTGVILPAYTSVVIKHILGICHIWKYDSEDIYLFQTSFDGVDISGYKTLDEVVELVQNAQDKLIEEWMYV